MCKVRGCDWGKGCGQRELRCVHGHSNSLQNCMATEWTCMLFLGFRLNIDSIYQCASKPWVLESYFILHGSVIGTAMCLFCCW